MIEAAAIRVIGDIYTGKRHVDAFQKAIGAGHLPLETSRCKQGFITDTGEFLNREDAAAHAFDCGQIKTKQRLLFSEDLW